MAKAKKQARKPAIEELAETLTLLFQTEQRLTERLWEVRDLAAQAFDARTRVQNVMALP
jgi:hypothetical protein